MPGGIKKVCPMYVYVSKTHYNWSTNTIDRFILSMDVF
jgi:hypothetical protein